MTRNELSCVIITLNEEENIAACIDSARKVCEEVIIVDSGSEDDTVKIASEKGTITIHKSWAGYAEARNTGAEKASHDFILSLDADERLSEELIESIRNLRPEKTAVYMLRRLTYLAGKPVYYSGWNEKIDRLYNRYSARWAGNFVHESLLPSNLKRCEIEGVLHHYSYSSPEDHQQRLLKYARLGAEKMYNQGKRYNPIIKNLKAIYRYFKTLVLQKGFLDGKLGLYIARQDFMLIIHRYNFLKILEDEKKVIK